MNQNQGKTATQYLAHKLATKWEQRPKKNPQHHIQNMMQHVSSQRKILPISHETTTKKKIFHFQGKKRTNKRYILFASVQLTI